MRGKGKSLLLTVHSFLQAQDVHIHKGSGPTYKKHPQKAHHTQQRVVVEHFVVIAQERKHENGNISHFDPATAQYSTFLHSTFETFRLEVMSGVIASHLPVRLKSLKSLKRDCRFEE